MKALFISSDPSIGVEGSATRARMRAYATHMEALHILFPAPSSFNRQDGNLFLHGVHTSKVLRLFTLVPHIRALIKEYETDVVSAQDPFEHGWAALRAVSGTHAKLHVQVHTDLLSPFFAGESFLNQVRVSIADRVLPRAAGIRVVSERIRHSLLSRYGDRIPEPTVIPIVPTPYAGPAVPFPEHRFSFVALAVGRLESEKHVQDIVTAIARVRRRYPSVGLFIAGDGRSRHNIMKHVAALKLHDAVSFLGSRTDVSGLMKSANVFVQASAYEGYGRTLLEAADAGLPILTTDVGIVGEVLHAEKEALVCPVGDIGCLANGITRLVEDNELRGALRRAAKEAAVAHRAAFSDIPAAIVNDLSETLQT